MIKKLRYLCTLLLIAVASAAWGDEVVYYTLDTSLEANKGTNNGYATAGDVTVGGITWNVYGNMTMQPWRIGGKNLDGIDRTAKTKTAVTSTTTKVVLTLGSATLTVNSVKLTVASDANFSTIVDEVTITSPTASSDHTFSPTEGTEWASGAYFKFTFNVTTSGTSNQFVQFSKVQLYTNSSSEPSSGEFSDASKTLVVGTSDYVNTLTTNPSGLTGITYSSDNENVATVESSTGVVSPVVPGKANIKASWNAQVIDGTEYMAGSASYTLYVANAIEDGVFDFTNYQDYGSGMRVGQSGSTDTDFKAGNVTLTAKTNFSWYAGTENTLRIYANGSAIISVPDGMVITKIVFTGADLTGGTIGGSIPTDGNEFTWEGSASSVEIVRSSSTMQFKTITVTYGEAPDVEAPTFSVATGSYIGTQQVVISSTTEGATIYYTTDGTNPTKESSVYSDPITVSQTTTIKAVAATDAATSTVASVIITIPTITYTSIAALKDAAPAEPVILTLTDAQVYYKNGNDMYVGDESGAIDFYKSGLSYTAGQKLKGSAVVTYTSYNSLPEITAVEDNQYVVTGGEAIPIEMEAADVTLDENVCQYIQIEGELTVNESSYYVDGLLVFSKWKSSTNIDLTKLTIGSTYKATGIVIPYNGEPELALTVIEEVTAPVPTHIVSFSVNGMVTSTEEVGEGAAITFPTEIEDINGKTFVGWISSTIEGVTNEAPEFVTSATMGNADVTYYAVFALASEGSSTETIELTNDAIQNNATGKGSYSDDYNVEGWTGRYLISSNSGVYSLQLGYNTDPTKSAHNSHLTTPLCSGSIKSITINTQNNTASGRTFYLCSASDIGCATSEYATYGEGSLAEQNGSVTIDITGEPKQFHIYPNGTAYVASVSLTFSALTFSAYATTVGERAAYAVVEKNEEEKPVSVTFYYDDQKANRGGENISIVDITDGSTEKEVWNPMWKNNPSGEQNVTLTNVTFDKSFKDFNGLTSLYCWFACCTNLVSITGLEYVNTSNVATIKRLFYNCQALTSIDVSNFNTSKVTDMSAMFYHCLTLSNINVSNFNTEKVTNMSSLFNGCTQLTNLDLSNFNTANVKDMSAMFFSCGQLKTLTLGENFKTAAVTNMGHMFYHCDMLEEIDLSTFDTSKVTNMEMMFSYCKSLTELDLSNFNTAIVTNLQYMFYYCSGLTTLDVSKFSTANVTNMSQMFTGCPRLTSIYVGEGWNTVNVPESQTMFGNCVALVGGAGTTFDATAAIDKTRAILDGGVAAPGYLTYKTAPSAPTFNPVGGEYTEAQTVAISAAEGTKIYYTTDGSQPSAQNADQVYTGPVTISQTATLKAIAVKGAISEAAEATYTIAVSTQKGDVNGDTKVDIADVTELVNIILDTEDPTAPQLAAGDFDGDNDLDADDVRALVEKILSEE